jgi:hypothetical protein
MQSGQESKYGHRIRTLHLKVSGKTGNRTWKLLEPVKEDKWIEVMNNLQMQIRQESKYDRQVQMSDSKDSCTH